MKTLSSLLAVLLAGAASAATPAVDPAEHKKAHELIDQLASTRYRDRERAAAELIKMGRAAKPALLEGRNNPDPEVQTRCQQLLPQALALDLAYRVERFLNDTDGKLQHDLPLWKYFVEKVGKDEQSRKLFAEMLAANGPLLESAEEEPARLTELVQRRYHEMYQELFGNPFGGGIKVGGYAPSALNAAELCTIMFAASLPAYKPSQPDWMLSNLYTQPNFTNRLKDEKEGTAYRKVFFHFLEARIDDNTINQCVWMLSQNRIKEGADVLARALKNGKTTQVYTKANTICAVGTLGSREHIPVIEGFLKDDTQVQPFFVGGRGQQRGAVKVRDIALAIVIHLNGKNPKDYGFTTWNPNPNPLIQYHQLGFATDEDRAKAFEKWAAETRPSGPADPKK